MNFNKNTIYSSHIKLEDDVNIVSLANVINNENNINDIQMKNELDIAINTNSRLTEKEDAEIFNRELIKNLQEVKKPQKGDKSIKPMPSINRNANNFNRGNNIIINKNPQTGYLTSHLDNSDRFKHKIKEMKGNVESYLETIRGNFNAYISNMKNKLVGSLNTIETVFELKNVENTYNGEEEKHKVLEKKLEDFTREMNGVVRDMQKFTK